MGDVVDAPGGSAEDEGLADARFEDHLLVELADADGLFLFAGEEDAVEAAIGDGAGVEDGEACWRLRAAVTTFADAIPGEARAELGEFVGGVPAAEQVEDVFERGAGEGAEGRGATDERVEDVDRDGRVRAGSSPFRRGTESAGGWATMATICWARTSRGLRGKRVDSMWPSCMARVTAAQATRSARYLGKRCLRSTASDLVAGAADALHAAGDGGRRLDLDDQIDRAHVDAELERGGGAEGADLSGLETALR